MVLQESRKGRTLQGGDGISHSPFFEPGKPQQANRAKADMKIKQGNLLKLNKILRLETTLCILSVWEMHVCQKDGAIVPKCAQMSTANHIHIV